MNEETDITKYPVSVS